MWRYFRKLGVGQITRVNRAKGKKATTKIRIINVGVDEDKRLRETLHTIGEAQVRLVPKTMVGIK